MNRDDTPPERQTNSPVNDQLPLGMNPPTGSFTRQQIQDSRAMALVAERRQRELDAQEARSRLEFLTEQAIREEARSRRGLPTASMYTAAGLPSSSLPPSGFMSRSPDSPAGMDPRAAQRFLYSQPDRSLGSPRLREALRMEELQQRQAALRMDSGFGGMGGSGFGGMGGYRLPYEQQQTIPDITAAEQRQLAATMQQSGPFPGHPVIHPSGMRFQQAPMDIYSFLPLTQEDFMGKRKADDEKEASKEEEKLGTPKRKKQRLRSKDNSFPLPASKQREADDTKPAATSKLGSYSRFWNKFNNSSVQEEVFRRRLQRGKIPLSGKTRSVILQGSRRRS